MNRGLITNSYATALLRYTEATGSSERVAAQIRRLMRGTEPEPVVLEPELERFTAMVIRHGRIELVKFIFMTYIVMYLKSRGEAIARLITVTPAPPELEQKLKGILEKRLGLKVEIETKTDESIIGGFIVEINNEYILDASVRSQLAAIRRQFVQQSNRIV